jgi:5-methylcytosine-specific restriction endonuclease McrA
MSQRTLVLNASFEPLGVVPLPRAVVLVLADKASVIEEDKDSTINSKSFSMCAPTVIRLNKFVHVPYRRHKIALNRKNLCERDDYTCAYCGTYGDTIDHVVPRFLGGENSWENVVAACKKCNGKKGHKTLAQLGWKLDFTPYEPSPTAGLVIALANAEEAWVPYLATGG